MAHLQFFQPHKAKQKNSKRATKPTHQDRHEMTTNTHDRKEGRSANTGLAKVAVQYSADTFVVNQIQCWQTVQCFEIRFFAKRQNVKLSKNLSLFSTYFNKY